jgi:hypothetical protein
VFVSGKPFQPSVMFVGEALSGSPDRLERLVRDQHASLLQKSMNYDVKVV